MNDQTAVTARDIGGGILGTLIRFSWRCSACVSGFVALVAGALYWKVSCAVDERTPGTTEMYFDVYRGLKDSRIERHMMELILQHIMPLSSHTYAVTLYPSYNILPFTARFTAILSNYRRCAPTSITKSTEISITIGTQHTL